MPVEMVSMPEAVGDDPSGDGDDADDEAGDEGGEWWLVVRVVMKRRRAVAISESCRLLLAIQARWIWAGGILGCPSGTPP
mmetsp:Transcript_19704/g.41416  ORF Transcript_19704/g.41416 Transcript_19704/m.41416 type:complete len:80 (+) Transcript_19704:364-603(+)